MVSNTRLLRASSSEVPIRPQDSSPDQVEDALGDVQSAGENDQTDQRRYAPAWEHPVVDLQHEDRPGQIEQVDHATHGADANERTAAGAQRITEFGTPDTGNGCHQILISSQGRGAPLITKLTRALILPIFVASVY